STLAFGILDPGATTANASFVLFNNGITNNLEITGASFSGPDAAAFSVVNRPDSLGPEESGQVQIRLDASAVAGSVEATLNLETNANPSVLSIALTALVQDPTGLLAHY